MVAARFWRSWMVSPWVMVFLGMVFSFGFPLFGPAIRPLHGAGNCDRGDSIPFPLRDVLLDCTHHIRMKFGLSRVRRDYCVNRGRRMRRRSLVEAGLSSLAPPAADRHGELAESFVVDGLLPHRLFDDLPGAQDVDVGSPLLDERIRLLEDAGRLPVAPQEHQGLRPFESGQGEI